MWQKIKNYYHFFQAVVANMLYGFPGRKATVIGVTGTDGKTTTTSLIYHILKTAGKKVSMITSVGAYIGDDVYDIGFHVTTPSPFGLQKYLRRAVDWGAEYIVLETTSHALDQNRVWGVKYTVGVLTNITHEHLDYHKNWEEYAETKLRLMDCSSWFVANKDDSSYELITKKVFSYSLHDQSADITPKKFPFKTKLLGEFNQYNCLAAIGACKALGIADDDIRKGLSTFSPPPGRQEVVYDKDFRVMIDFAHTPNAFARLLPAVRNITKGRIIHVFGSAGLRDHTKRPQMGKESSKYADIIILTTEDPRTEKISEINSSIKSGIQKKEVFDIPDRKEAIEKAIGIAKKGDTVLLTGKSHEKSMNLGSGEESWDEFGVVREALGT